jgi:hypothetical protein
LRPLGGGNPASLISIWFFICRSNPVSAATTQKTSPFVLASGSLVRVVSASAPGPAPRQRRRRGSCGSLCAFPDMPRQREALYDSGRTNPGVPANASITEVACWAHCRRKFFDVWQATKSPVAKEALDRIAATDLSPKFPPLRSRVLGCRHARRDGVSRSGRALFLCPGRFPGHRRAQPGSRLATGEAGADGAHRALAMGARLRS